MNPPCTYQHLWSGNPPIADQIELEGRPCDCGKFIFHSEECGCPSNKHMDLKLQENPNYIPQ